MQAVVSLPAPRQTPACSYFTHGGYNCDAISSCSRGPASLDLQAWRLPEAQRCLWDRTPGRWRRRADLALAAVASEGPPLQHLLTDAGFDSLHSPDFGECPVGGAALRLLHVWATASYHHGMDVAQAFATEAEELTFRPELLLATDVVWEALLASPWSGVFFSALARLAGGLCERLARKGPACEGAPRRGCDAARAADALAGSEWRGSLGRARELVSDCAPGGRLSELLRASGAQQLFSRLAALAAPPPVVPGAEGEDGRGEQSEVEPRTLGALAVREEVMADTLAAIGLAASLRRQPDSRGQSSVELLVFVERLKSSGHFSGFFNVLTENKCEMDFFAHFHRVFCVVGPPAPGAWGPLLVPADMTSGLLVHPPYGPASWACPLPAESGADGAGSLLVEVLDPVLWDAPLSLDVAPLPQGLGQRMYDFAACPQPLYRLEAHAGRVRDWVAYHRRLGVEHWTIYDLDGSSQGLQLGEEDGVELVPHLPEALGSPRLREGNAWNPICLEAIAQTQCFWRYRGRARWVLSLHSFDEYLVSTRQADRALAAFDAAVLRPAALRGVAVVRLPAVNYGGEPAVEDAEAPLVQRFRRHDGRLYWHVVAASPALVLSVNTTNARARLPYQHLQYWEPDELRVNHYVDALGARQRSAHGFRYEDPARYLAAWAGDWLAGLRQRRPAAGGAAEGLALRLAVLGRHAALRAAAGGAALSLAEAIEDASAALPPVARVALGLAAGAEAGVVEAALAAAFRDGDRDGDGLLDAGELRDLALPSGWDAHLRRRDLHAQGLYLHAWLAEEGDWEASGLLRALDGVAGAGGQDRAGGAPGDGRVSLAEWSGGLLRLCRCREAAAAASLLAPGPRPASRELQGHRCLEGLWVAGEG